MSKPAVMETYGDEGEEGRDQPVVIANNRINNRQAQTRATVGVFCRKKRLKMTLPGPGRLIHSDPVVLYLNKNCIVLSSHSDLDIALQSFSKISFFVSPYF